MVYIVESPYTNIYENLALEEYFFQSRMDGMIVMLWRNEDCVVIGKNQNAEAECRLSVMNNENILLARRKTGGGAVFQDLGNLNYSFICDVDRYDEKKQLSIITDALKALGVYADKSGRNDLVTDEGFKLSGTAFRQRENRCLHHGTLMVAVDIDKMVRCLSPSAEKLQSKGIQSVRSRVKNICDYCSGIDVNDAMKSIVTQLKLSYGQVSTDIIIPKKSDLSEAFENYKSKRWNLYRKIK